MDQDTSVLQQIFSKLEQASTALDKLAAAYVKAWGAVEHVVKDANNPHFGSDYATLEATINAVRPPFALHGLALLQAPGKLNAAGDRISVDWMLFHSSGQMLRGCTELPIGGKSTAQAAGSAITYARRYQVLALAGIAPKDDDGNEASSSPAPQEKRGPGRPAGSKNKSTPPSEPPAESEAGADEPEEKPAKKEKGSKQGAKEAVQNEILECKTLEQLEALKQRVLDINDAETSEAYVLRRKTIKSKG